MEKTDKDFGIYECPECGWHFMLPRGCSFTSYRYKLSNYHKGEKMQVFCGWNCYSKAKKQKAAADKRKRPSEKVGV